MINDVNQLGLRKNPFVITPSPGAELIWAGMRGQKERIEGVYKRSFSQISRQVILNWGPIGGGKTFASYYFQNMYSEGSEIGRCIQGYVRTPKEGSGASIQLFKSIIDSLRLSNIRKDIRIIIEEIGVEELRTAIESKIRSEEFTDAIIKLADLDQKVIDITTGLVYGTASNTDLKKIGLYRQLKSDNDYNKFLSGIIIALTLSSASPTRLFVWIDEMEDLVYYTSKQFKQFSQAIRDLVDTINEKFVLFLNFTLSEGEDETVKMLLGEALWSRIDSNIRFKDLQIADGIEYVQDLLISYQLGDDGSPYSPFTEDVILSVIESLPSSLLNPREINKKMNALLYFAQSNDVTVIDRSIYNSFEVYSSGL